MKFMRVQALAATAALMMAGTAATAQDAKQGTQAQAQQQSTEQQSKQTKNQKVQKLSRPDGEWLTLNGKVVSVSDQRFELSVSGQQVTVELDDYDWESEAIALRPGDRVTVSGAMDKEFFGQRKIEASSVYIDKLNQYVYASSADEESGYTFSYLAADRAQDDDWVSFVGTVISQNGEEILLDTGIREISIDTSELAGREELTSIDAGDRISVYGEMDDADLFEGREVIASSVTLLSAWP